MKRTGLQGGIAGMSVLLFLLCDRQPTLPPPHYTIDAVDSVLTASIPLSITTVLNASHTSISRYGINPLIAVAGNSDNSFDVALYASQTRQIQVLSFDANGTKTGEITPAAITGARALLGFAKITDDGSFVAGWSKDNAFGNQAFEFWITRFDKTGNELFSTRIFGDKNRDSLWSKGEPGAFSSARIAFNPTTRKIGFYCGHTMKWGDSVRHQGGFVGFMDLAGAFDTANGWFFSHNFDQRFVVVDSFYYALAHGDAYPRALGFSKWNDVPPRGRNLVDAQYFAIPGNIGDNTTNTQTGGIQPLPDGNFGVVFSSSVNRSSYASYDVCYMKISAAGSVLATVWLTGYDAATFALFPKIAGFSGNLLIAWEEVTGGVPVTRTVVIDMAGNCLSPAGELDNVRLSPFCDLVTLPGGGIVWATLKAADTLSLCRITP